MPNVVEFLIFITENYAVKKDISGGETERTFERYQVDQYLRDSYEVMHTYPLETILSYVDEYIEVVKSA
jgi:hypothetical protein